MGDCVVDGVDDSIVGAAVAADVDGGGGGCDNGVGVVWSRFVAGFGDFGTRSGGITAWLFTGSSSYSSGFMKLDDIGPSSEIPRWIVGLYFGMKEMGDVFLDGTRNDDVRRKFDLDNIGVFVGLDGDFAVVNDVVIFAAPIGDSLAGVDVAFTPLELNRSSNWRLADMNGSYLSENPLSQMANERENKNFEGKSKGQSHTYPSLAMDEVIDNDIILDLRPRSYGSATELKSMMLIPPLSDKLFIDSLRLEYFSRFFSRFDLLKCKNNTENRESSA